MVVVVFPTPPFWLHIAMIRAGPCEASGAGTGKSGSSRPVAPRTASVVVTPAPSFPSAPPVATVRSMTGSVSDTGRSVSVLTVGFGSQLDRAHLVLLHRHSAGSPSLTHDDGDPSPGTP